MEVFTGLDLPWAFVNQYSYLSLFLAHPSVYPDMSFTVFEIQKNQKGLYLNRKGMCIFFLRSVQLTVYGSTDGCKKHLLLKIISGATWGKTG